MADPRWLDDREQRMWRKYHDMRRHLDGALERQLTGAGLSAADYELLVPLSEAPERRLRARELRHMVGWDRSRLAHHMRRMEQRGLVVREECETDARGTVIRLTDEGFAAVEAAAPGHVETVRRYFIDLLSSEEIDIVSDIATRVLDRLAEGPCKAAIAPLTTDAEPDSCSGEDPEPCLAGESEPEPGAKSGPGPRLVDVAGLHAGDDADARACPGDDNVDSLRA